MRKRKKSDNGSLQGVTCVDEQVLFPLTDNRDDFIEQVNILQWEYLRRNEEFKKICTNIQFGKHGTVDLKWLQQNRSAYSEKVERMREYFRTDQIFDPSKSYKELQPDMISTFGVFPPIVKALVPKEKESKKNEENIKRFISDERYITIQVDITKDDSTINQLIFSYIGHYRKILGIKSKIESERTHLNKRHEDLTVFDMIESGLSPTEVIKKLWPEEYKSNDLSDSDNKYEELSQKYRNEGLSDWDTRAHNEAYEKDTQKGQKAYTRVFDIYQRTKNRVEFMQFKT